MSYSETSELIEQKGYPKAFEDIYKEYIKNKAEYELKKKAADDAKREMEFSMTHAYYFVTKAAQNEIGATEEDGSYVVRRIVENEVVHFRRPIDDSEKIIIGYWPITPMVIE